MKAIDTNVLVRVFINDDSVQHQKAKALIQSVEQNYISETVFLESEWVLRNLYNLGFEQIGESYELLFGYENISISNPQKLSSVLQLYKSGFDFGDAFHVVSSNEWDTFYTFDKKLIKKSRD